MPRRGMPPPPRPSKYQPLVDFLAAQDTDTVRLSFPEIAAILSFAVPDNAHVDSAWWRNDARPWVRALTEAGWQAHLRIVERAVIFTRATSEE